MRSKKSEQQSGLSKLIGVALTNDQVRERGEMIAAKVIHIETLRKRLKQQSSDIRDEIKQCEQAVGALARVITAHEENKAQRDLFVGQTQVEATRMITVVGKHAAASDALPVDPAPGDGDDAPANAAEDQMQDVEGANQVDEAGNGNGRSHARKRKKAPARAKPASRGRRAHI